MEPSDTNTEDAKRHIQEIRAQKFSVGKKESNPLTQDLHHAVTSLSAELYTKDVHFLMELIQNAEDNEYGESVEPTLEFVLTKEDITETGAPATLLVFNNEVGFSRKNMDSLCSVGRSTKKGKRQQGFIGEKGIGFKSVFLVSPQPHVFSNGYRVRFREEPDPCCGIGYIVPEWVVGKPHLSEISRVYGSKKALPKTIFVLPLKPGKVEAVKAQLSELHPEILLFLSKVKRLYVRENNCDPKKDDNISIVSISSETDHVKLSSEGADSRFVQLSVEEKTSNAEETCKYFMWRQAFPVKPECRISSRANVEQWIITLAFPFGKRLKRGTSSVGVFAFLPTAMVTNFPFVIQADFILASSRESILFDNVWNLRILECVPSAFVNAFQACVKDRTLFPSVCQVFKFLPALKSSYIELKNLRRSIRNKLQKLRIMPSELFNGTIHFTYPCRVIRVVPIFRDILSKLKNKGVNLCGLYPMKKVLHLSLDHENYRMVLDFLGVASIQNSLDWYAECIKSCNLVSQASPDVYIEMLRFVARYEKTFPAKYFWKIPLLKYTSREGNVQLCSIPQIMDGELTVKYASNPEVHSWLSKCNMELGCLGEIFFLPSDIQESLIQHEESSVICCWLSYSAGITSSSACDYGNDLWCFVSEKEDRLALAAHFLYHSHRKKFIDESKIYDLCAKIPVIDGSGCVRKGRKITLISSSGSNWVKLFGPNNPYLDQNYVDIGGVYAKGCSFVGESTPDKVVLDFLSKYSKAMDLPELSPPNVELKIASSQLSMEQVFQLLDWIRLLRTKGLSIPEKFIGSIQTGKWVKTYTGYKSPRQCILPDVSGKLVYDMMKNVLNEISVIDQKFYSDRIHMYQDELRFLGVGFCSDDVLRLVTARFKSLIFCGLKREMAFSLLMFIGYLKQRNVVDEQWLQAMKSGKWLKTRQGYNAPEGSVFLPSDMDLDSYLRITNLPIVDKAYYGIKLGSFSSELRLLGVAMDADELYKLIAEKASFPANLPSMSSACGLLILTCIKKLGSVAVASLIERIRHQSWLKTTSGFTCPSETAFPNATWGSLVRELEIPVIDESYYGDEINHFVDELKAIGVAVDTVSIVEIIATRLKCLALSSKLAPSIVLSILDCFGKLGQISSSGCTELQWLSTEKWLKTRHGYKAPNESIISNPKWGAISFFVELPLIDDVYYGIGIYKYKDELQKLGVITDFEAGTELVLKGLNSPIEPEFITADGTMALLECMKFGMSKSPRLSIPNSFVNSIAKSKCLKTTHGYLVPEECVLFDSAWEITLRQSDVPSIDVKFYHPNISLYKDQLKAIGVKIDPMEVCSLISQILFLQSETPFIKRLYSFLSQYNWRPEKLDKCNSQVWIPNHVGDAGKWVNSELCVLHDTDDLFGSRLYSLYSSYERELLPLFSSAFGVQEVPSMGEYLQLWSDWGSSPDHQVPVEQCHSFWDCISKNWKPEAEIADTLKQNLIKVSATACSNNTIHLVEKEQVFILDDLRLTKIFANVSVPLFAWFPKYSGSSSTLSRRLFEIYISLGVKKVSESVKLKLGRNIISTADQPKKPLPRNGMIEKGLIKIILAFLASPQFDMAAKDRQGKAASLLNLSLYKIDQPIKVSYCLTPARDATVEVETKKMVFWHKISRQLFIDKSGHRDRKKNAEFGSCFAQEIAEGLLPEGREPAVASLSKIIHFGFVYEFNEESVDYLLMRENLECLVEDNEFLCSAFSCYQQSGGAALGKRTYNSDQLAPCTPSALSKKRCTSDH